MRHGIKAKPCMESSRSDVWNQSAGKCTLKRDAMRDFVAIPYNAQVRWCHTNPADWIKKSTAKRWIFLAEGVGFEPTCLSANGFQDRLVMTTSISLRGYLLRRFSYFRENFARELFNFCVLENTYIPYITRIFEGTEWIALRGFSRPPRYDHFDNPPCIQFYQKSQSKSRKIARKLRETLLAKCIRWCEKPNKIKGFQEIT